MPTTASIGKQGKLRIEKELYCPFAIIKQYINLRPTALTLDENFFVFSDRSPVNPGNVRSVLKLMIQHIGLDANLYNFHAIRIGCCSDLLKLGLSVETIKKLGCWRSNAVFTERLKLGENVIQIILNLFTLFSDNIRAKEDIWFIGDTFLKDTIDALFAMKKAVVIIKQPKPYIFNYFNISSHYIRGIARLLNPLIHGLNEEAFLAQLIVVILDVDMLKYLAIKGKASSLVIGSMLHYAIMQFDLYIERRKQDLASKCLGALIPADTYPKIIWVRIPKRPKAIAKDIFLQQRKNSI